MHYRHARTLVLVALVVMLALAACAPAPAPAMPTAASVPTQAPAPTTAPTSAPTSAPTIAPAVAATTAPTSAPAAAATVAATQAPAATTAATTGAFTVTDAMSRTVKFDKVPQRIAMAGKAYFMVADAIYLFPEAIQRVVAMPGATSGSQGSGNFMAVVDSALGTKTLFANDVGAEQIAPTKPDVVILKSVASKLGDSLQQINIPVVYVDLETPAQYQRDLAILGKVLGNPDRAQKLAAYYTGVVDRVTGKTKALKETDKPKVLLLQYAEKSGTVAFSVAPASWIQTGMVEMAGGNAVWKAKAEPSGWAVANLEQIAAWNPDQVFVVSYFGDPSDAVAKIKADSKWQALPAAKNGKIYAFPMDFYSWDQSDTRWALGLTWLATKIQPALFSDIKMSEEINQFYTLYGLDAAAVKSKVTPLIKGDLP